MTLRLMVFTPFWGAVLVLMWHFRQAMAHRVWPVVVELVVWSSSVAAGAALSYILASSHSPQVQFYHVGLMVVVLYGNLVQRLRFWFAVLSTAAIVGMHVHGALTAPGMDARLIMPMIALLIVSSVFSLIANHVIDRDDRRTYVLSLRNAVLLEELDRIQAEVSLLSRVDPLTGLFNRRHLEEALQDVLGRRERAAPGIAAIMVDVDHFKRYNDHHGHAAGDRCLCEVAAALTECIRGPSDFVVRMGGEEFIAILYPASAEAALQVAERMQAVIRERAVRHGDSPTAPIVTTSMGVAWLPASAPDAQHRLVRLADEALYEAKRAGRNRCHLARTADIAPTAGTTDTDEAAGAPPAWRPKVVND